MATVRTEPSFAVESREELFPWDRYSAGGTHPEWDLSTGGNRILAIPITGDLEEGGQLILVQNFFEELRQVVPE
jgi:hypothetical protein